MATKKPRRDTAPEIINAHTRDGQTFQVVVPQSREDVENQPGVPAHVLALLAFAPRVNGLRRWSEFTKFTLSRLADQYGDDNLRSVLANLLDDITHGFSPTNPVGVFIHRVRATATTSNLTI